MAYHVHDSEWDRPMPTLDELAIFCGGSGDSFTGMLLHLMCKADPGNRLRLAGAFPEEDAALAAWQAIDWPTFGRLLEALTPVWGTDGTTEKQAEASPGR